MRSNYATYVAVGLAGYPVVSFIPAFLQIPSRFATLPFRAVYLAASIWFLWMAIRRRRLVFGPVWVPLTAFWVLYCLRLAADLVYFPVSTSLHPLEFVLYAIGMCAIPMLACFRSLSPEESQRAERAVIVLSVCACIMAIGFNFTLLGSSFGRLHGNEYLNPITLGHVAATVIALSIWNLLRPIDARVLPTSVLIASIPAALIALAMSASRGPVLALALLLFLLSAAAVRLGRHYRVATLMAVAGIAGPAIMLSAADLGSGLLFRIQKTATRVATGGEPRLLLWRDAWSQFASSPLVGSGLEEKNALTYPHNIVLESFMATGVLGGAAFTLVLCVGLVTAWRLVRSGGGLVWLGLLFVQNVVWALFSGSLYSRPEFWSLLGLVISGMYSAHMARRREHAAGYDRPVHRPIFNA